MRDSYSYFGKLLNFNPLALEKLDIVMREKTGKTRVFERLQEEQEQKINTMLLAVKAARANGELVAAHLRKAIFEDERELLRLLDMMPGENEFERAAALAKKIGKTQKGFFLKKEIATKILLQRPPAKLLAYLKCKTVEEMLQKVDVTEAFSALRFIETDQWMHETFDVVYSSFTPADFETRALEIKVLGPQWAEVAKKFVAKKHHNVSHLKEFGVIFLNPIREDVPGKFLRDFALLFHYFHEIRFYSKLFEYYAPRADFSTRLKSLLRGDVPEARHVPDGTWLIVQRYLAKENPQDPRLFLPRINPESFHWHFAERDLAQHYTEQRRSYDLKIWNDYDWVGMPAVINGTPTIVSFDMEDTAMSLVSFSEGRLEYFNYHQREALWTKIFSAYAGGEAATERLLVENFEKGMIAF